MPSSLKIRIHIQQPYIPNTMAMFAADPCVLVGRVEQKLRSMEVGSTLDVSLWFGGVQLERTRTFASYGLFVGTYDITCYCTDEEDQKEKLRMYLQCRPYFSLLSIHELEKIQENRSQMW